MADFVVLMLWDADDYFGHYQTTKYLPDFDFTGMVLSFNLATTGVQPINSPAYQWIPWRSLSYIAANGQPGTVDLAPYISYVSGTVTAASTTVTVTAGASGAAAYDRVTIWYQNIAFDYIATGGETAAAVATALAGQINAYGWTASGISLPLSASVTGSAITISCTVAGSDGNSVTLYTQSKNTNLVASPSVAPLTGGVSAGTYQVTINFSTLGITSLRQAWLTIAPQIQNATGGNPWPTTDYQDTEWTYTVTNWAVSDPNNKRPLKIAGPGSVRVGSMDAWTTYSGSGWSQEASNQPGGTGWFYRGFAQVTSHVGDSVSIQYSCQSTHDLYIGTSLYVDRGIVSVSLDGVAQPSLDCFLNGATEPVVTPRKVASSVSAGSHLVVITLQSTNHTALGAWDNNSSGHYFYFDYLAAVVPGEVTDPAVSYPAVMPATDFDTDHSYRLSPERLVWMLSRLGFAGMLDHYLGVFWWNQRKRVGGTFPVAVVTFSGTWVSGDAAFLNISGSTIGKSVFPADNSSSIAAHFAYFINSSFTGIRATASAGVLTITNRTPEFSFTLSTSTALATGSTGAVSSTGSLSGGVEGNWMIDDTVTPVINRAVTDWHADFWAQVKAQGWTASAAFSMELVNPPDATGHVYAQRYANGSAVLTDTGFGGLSSTQCTFNAVMRAYQQEAYKEMAGLMGGAGLAPYLQFGEFVWWYFAFVNLLAVGYASYTSPISIGTAAAHGLSTGNKVYIAGVLGCTAANGTWTITVTDATHFTLNGSSGNGTYTGGGTITGGGMALYDVDTSSAASTALGRSLATFSLPTDDPSVNSYADANFLRGLIYSHCSAIASYVQATYPTTKFEVLWPDDVNYPTLTPVAKLGGSLNRYINLPSQWMARSGSGLDRFKMEALAFGATERNMTLAKQAMSVAFTSPLTWPLANTAYLIPIFNGGCPWQTEYLSALNFSLPSLNPWAFDHFCLLSWPMPLPKQPSSASIQ